MGGKLLKILKCSRVNFAVIFSKQADHSSEVSVHVVNAPFGLRVVKVGPAPFLGWRS